MPRLPLRPRRSATVALLAAGVLALCVPPLLPDSPQQSPSSASATAPEGTAGPTTPAGFTEPDVDLPGDEHVHRNGEDAIEALGGPDGSATAKVAEAYGMTPQDLVRRLRADSSLNVDGAGRLLYADTLDGADGPEQHSPEAAETTSAPQELATSGATDAWVNPSDPSTFDPDDAFFLHSRPESTKTLYLDFDGHTFGPDQYWGLSGFHCAWDPAGDGSGFSTHERAMVHETWQRVAAAFETFDVDVTTQEPTPDALRRANSADQHYGVRAVISGNISIAQMSTWDQAPRCDGAGGSGTVGLAYYSTWGATGALGNTPALVAGAKSADQTAWIIEHEFGHNFSLVHTFERAGDDASDVSPLHARIMDYAGPRQLLLFPIEDRGAIRQRAGAVTDGAGHDLLTASPARATQTGVLDQASTPLRGEEDWYSLEGCTTFAARAVPGSPYTNVDLKLSLRDAEGNEVASNAPAGRLDAHLTADLAVGDVRHLVVTTASAREGGADLAPGAPANGVHRSTHPHGTYRLDVAGCAGTSDLLPPAGLGGGTSPDGTTTVTWQPLAEGVTPAREVEVAVDGRRVVTLPPGSTTHTVSTTPDAPVRFRVRYRTGTRTSPWAEARTHVTPGTPELFTAVRSQGTSDTLVRLNQDARRPATSARIYFVNGANGMSSFYNFSNVPTSLTIPYTYAPLLGSTVTVRYYVDWLPGYTEHHTTVVLDSPGAPSTTGAPTEAPRALRTEFLTPAEAGTGALPSLHLTWRRTASNTDAAVTGYQVRLDDTTDLPAVETSPGVFAAEVPADLTGVHTVTVRAVNAAGNGPAAELTLDVEALQAPAAPRDVEIREVDGRTWLQWSPQSPVRTPGVPTTTTSATEWEIEVNGTTARIPAQYTSIDLTGFRSERRVVVKLRGVDPEYGPSAQVSVTLAPDRD